MHDALVVRRRERVRQRDTQLHDARDRQPARRHLPIQAMALDQLHRQEPDAVLVFDRVERDDIRVVEAGHGARLVLEARQAFGVRRHVGRQHLERDVATEAAVAGAVHFAHAARAERGDDLVFPESGSRGKCHGENLCYFATPCDRRGSAPPSTVPLAVLTRATAA